MNFEKIKLIDNCKSMICDGKFSGLSNQKLDRLVGSIVDFMLVWGVSASVAYWFVLLLRLPAWVWYPTVVSVFLVVIIYSPIRFSCTFCFSQKKWAVILLLSCVASASISVFTNRPDSDDIAFSHRAIVAANDLSIPIALVDTAHDELSLPPITPLHVFTSVEVTTALVAKVLNVPQVAAIHLGLGALVNFMLPAICFLLLRFFRVPTAHAVFGSVATLLFLLMSGNAHRDWGNFTIMRSWQGKCILMEIIVPLAILYSLRFHLYGRRCDFYRLHAVVICGIGLSGTGLFLIPFVIGASGVAVLVANKFARYSLIRAGVSASVLIEVFVVSALPWIGALPKLGDISFYITGGWPRDGYENLSMVFHSNSVPLYFFYLVAAAFLRKSIELLSFFIYLGVVSFLLTMPGVQHVLINIVTPGAFWRFSYAIFVPIVVGLAVAGLARSIKISGVVRFCAVPLFVIIVVATFVVKKPVLNYETISEPTLKFAKGSLEGAREVSNYAAKGSVILAPPSIVTPLGLLRPDLKFVVTRPTETLLAFTNAGLKDEGSIRAALGGALEVCDLDGVESIRAERHWPNMRLVVYPRYCSAAKIRFRLGLGDNWREVNVGGYSMLILSLS